MLERRSSEQNEITPAKRIEFLRREFILAALSSIFLLPRNADALVRGVAPPPDFGKRPTALGKTNIVEAREAGAAREAELFDKADGQFQVTAAGDRYRDIVC